MDERTISFETTLGVEVKGETWSCVEIPDSVAFFGSGRGARVDVQIDDLRLENVGTLPTGRGSHMVSINAKARKHLGKEIGDLVAVTVTRR